MSKIVIITLNYNQNDYTLKCIDSILESQYRNFRIILVDNGAEDKSHEELKHNLPDDSRITIYWSKENLGYVGGVNLGLKLGEKCNPDYYMILNNDTILDKDAIGELVTTCKEFDNKAIITGKVYHYDEPRKLQDIGYTFKNKKKLLFNRIGLNEIDNGQYDNMEERDMLDDVFWLFPAKLYAEIGGYSPYFWFNAEQADFALRAKKAGYKLVYTPYAKLWHKGSVSIGGREKNPKYAYWAYQSMLIYKYRNMNKFLFWEFYLTIIISYLASLYKSIKNYLKNKENTFNYPKAKLLAIMYFNKWLLLRNNNQGKNPCQ